MPSEIEAKLKVADLAPLRDALRRLGAVQTGDGLERNWVLDDDSGSLLDRQILLRVRNVGGEGGILTVKRPIEGSEFKSREEIETHVESSAVLLAQFAALGYRVRWIYEKFRQTWRWRDCNVALDRCPEIGLFVEIEGEPGAIREVCADLGLDPAAHIGDTYLKLWIKHLAERGEARRDMTFPPDGADESGG